jgi:hypothetical protein
MPHPARTALVLQGGGALGAYELGAPRRLYKDDAFAPDVIAGVSIGGFEPEKRAALRARLSAINREWRSTEPMHPPNPIVPARPWCRFRSHPCR